MEGPRLRGTSSSSWARRSRRTTAVATLVLNFGTAYKFATDWTDMKSLIVLMMVTRLLVADAQAQRTTLAPGFVVYDGTLYMQKPDLTHFGLSPITVIYSSSMWNSTEDRLSIPNAKVVHTLALTARRSTGIAVIDIENWPNIGFPAKVADSVQKYQATIKLFKRSAPSLRVGYYGVVPIFNYRDAIREISSPGYSAWQATKIASPRPLKPPMCSFQRSTRSTRIRTAGGKLPSHRLRRPAALGMENQSMFSYGPNSMKLARGAIICRAITGEWSWKPHGSMQTVW